MFDDLEYLMKQVMDKAPPGAIDPNRLEEDLRLGRAENQTSPQLRTLAQANLPVESFVRLAAQQTKKEEPKVIANGGYDMDSANEFESSTGMSLFDPTSKHWASRVYMGPNTGLILKHPEHPTFNKTLRGERRFGSKLMIRRDPAGNTTKYNGRLFSFTDKDKYDSSIYEEVSESQLNKWRYMPYDAANIADSITPFEVVENAPKTWGFDNDSGTFKVYYDSKGIPTIGIGSNIGPERKKEFIHQLSIVAPEKEYDDILAGRIGLTRDEVDQIFMMNVREHILTAEDLKVELDEGITVYPFEDLSEFPEYLQQAVVNGVFWSMLTPRVSPNTMKLIANGDWEGASKEFLIGKWQDEQKVKNGSTWKRFLLISDALARYGKELKGSKDTQASGYIIKEGDTLWGISKELDMTVEELQDMNPELDPRNIPVGYKLKTMNTETLTAETKDSEVLLENTTEEPQNEAWMNTPENQERIEKGLRPINREAWDTPVGRFLGMEDEDADVYDILRVYGLTGLGLAGMWKGNDAVMAWFNSSLNEKNISRDAAAEKVKTLLNKIRKDIPLNAEEKLLDAKLRKDSLIRYYIEKDEKLAKKLDSWKKAKKLDSWKKVRSFKLLQKTGRLAIAKKAARFLGKIIKPLEIPLMLWGSYEEAKEIADTLTKNQKEALDRMQQDIDSGTDKVKAQIINQLADFGRSPGTKF